MLKTLHDVTVKDAAKGEVSAVFSTFNVVDKDGDITPPGAIKDGMEVVISAYGHGSHSGKLPVGKGVIRTTKSEAILDGQFFLNTEAGRETFEVVKELGSLGEWSYSLHDVKFSFEERDGKQVRILEEIGHIKEVSPVLIGAGVNTRTLTTKGLSSLQDQIAAAMGVVDEVIEGAERVVALRAEQGKSLSQVNTEGLDGLTKSLDRLKTLLTADVEQATEAATENTPDDIAAIAADVRRRELFSHLNHEGV